MDRLWGEMVPVPESQLRVLRGRRDADRRRVRGRLHAGPRLAPRRPICTTAPRSSATPAASGSRSHRLTRPADPAARHRRRGVARLDRADPRRGSRERLAMTHFGSTTDVDAQLDELACRLDALGRAGADARPEEFIARWSSEAVACRGRTPSGRRPVHAGRAARPAVRRARPLLAQAGREAAAARRLAGILTAMSQTVELPR